MYLRNRAPRASRRSLLVYPTMATSSPSSPDADDMISIRVKSVVGRHPPFIVRLSLSRDTLGSLKQAIHAETTFPASSQTLVHVGQTLRLDARTRLSESLQGDSTVFLVVRHADGRPGSGPRWSAGTAAEGAASSGESKNDASSASAASVVVIAKVVSPAVDGGRARDVVAPVERLVIRHQEQLTQLTSQRGDGGQRRRGIRRGGGAAPGG